MHTRSCTGLMVMASAAVSVAFAQDSQAAINLELRPGAQSVFVGQTVSLDLYAVSDSAISQGLAAIDLLLNWDTTYLSLIGADLSGSPFGFAPGFATDSTGLNTSLTDGDAKWVGFAAFGSPIMATTSGTFLASFDFLALAPTIGTLVDIPVSDLPNVGAGTGDSTKVFDGTVPNFTVTGSLTGGLVQINVPAPSAMLAVLGGLALMGRRRRA